MKNHFVALDLELNQPSQRIIQLGAVIGHFPTGRVVDEFCAFVNPGEALDPRIIELTGVQQEDVDGAGPLVQAYDELVAWLAPYAADRQLNPLTWGGGDSHSLRQALGLADERWVFGRRWTDVKTLYVAWRTSRGDEPRGGLARAMTKFNLAFEGRKHNARDDARNTFRMFVALCAQFQPATAR